MQFDILTLFPAMFEGPLNESILKKAQEKGFLLIKVHDIRQKCGDKHKTADDSSFGGGPGMVMLLRPILEILKNLKKSNTKTILMSPSGSKLNQKKVKEFSHADHLIIICGHYEGIDERIMSEVDEEISMGDYVLTGGELPAMVLIDAVSRYIPGVVKEKDSVDADSFSDGILDFPHYTRPSEFEGQKVPDVLMSGNHEEIRKWRRREALSRTLFRRPDLFAQAKLTDEDKNYIESIILGTNP